MTEPRNWRVRSATRDDLQLWSTMRHELWPDSGAEGHRADLESELMNPKFQGFFAESDGDVAGFAEAYVRDFANGCDGRPVAFLEGIWVRPSSRRQGISRKLVAAVEAWAKSKGIAEIGSDALIDNALSHQSHAGWGFEETERVVYFRKKLH